ncbi:unnamed protein product, partial [Vitis vinifera]
MCWKSDRCNFYVCYTSLAKYVFGFEAVNRFSF